MLAETMEGILNMKKWKSISTGVSCLSILLAAGIVPVTASDDTVTVQTSEVIPSCVPKALADLMALEGVTLAEIQKVVAQRGYYPEGTPFENYAEDFVQGCLIGAWPNVFALIKENREIPF